MTLCTVHRVGSKANRPSGRTGPGRLTPLAIRRALFADRFLPRYQADLLRVFRRHAAQVADEALVGMPDFAGHLTQWTVELSHAKKRYLYTIAALGWRLAGLELGVGAKAQAAKDPWALWWEGADPAADPATAAPAGVTVEVGGPGEGGGFLLRGDFDSIDQWIQTTSLGESQTSAKRFRKIWEEAAASFDPKTGRAWTAVQIRKEIERRFSGMVRSRANMLARTGTVWAINEGAHQRYRAEGVAAEEWVATVDDVTCLSPLTAIDGPRGSILAQDIAVGDSVYTHRGTGTVVSTIRKRHTGKFAVVITKRAALLVTDDHRVFVEPGMWIAACALRFGDRVHLATEKTGKVLGVIDFVLPNADDVPTVLAKVRGLLRILFRVVMPVVSVYLQGDAIQGNREVDDLPPDCYLRNESNLQGFKRMADCGFNGGFAGIGDVTAHRTEPSLCARDMAKCHPAGLTLRSLRWAVAFLRTVVSSAFRVRRAELFPTPLALNPSCEPIVALPTADGIPIPYRRQNVKNDTTNGTNLSNSTNPDTFQVASTGAESSTGRSAFMNVERPPTFVTRFRRSRLGRFVVALTTTIRDLPLLIKSLTALLARLPRSARHTWTFLRSLYRLWRCNRLVFDIEVSNGHTYYADGILVHNCPYCMEMDGKIVAINDPFWGVNDGDFQPPGVSTPLRQPPFSIEHPPLHPNCLIGETPVVAPGKVAGLVASYSGPVIEITFADSRRLTITPNHMLLTPRGFARAASLREGDDVVDCSAFEGVVATNPDNDRKPSLIKDVVKSLAESCAVSAARVPVSPIHLHGDAAFVNGEVDVIAADGFLRNDGEAMPPEPLLQSDLGPAAVDKSTLDTERNLTPVLLALALSTDGGVGVREEGTAFLQREPLHSEFIRLATGSYIDAGADEAPSNTCSANTKRQRESELRLPVGVTTARVTGLSVRQFSGHVYDLQSSSTLYIANGLVSSNCRCTIVPVLLESDEAVPVQEARAYNPETVEQETVEAAAAWAQAHGVRSAIYHTKKVKIANMVNETVNEIIEKGLPVPTSIEIDTQVFRRYRTSQRKQIPALYELSYNRIIVNPKADYWKNPVEHAKAQHIAGWWSTPHERHVLRHEFGHFLNNKNSPRSYLAAGMDPQVSTAHKLVFAEDISRYAVLSKREFVAEVSAGLLDGRKFSDHAMRIYSSLGGIPIK